MSPVYRLFVVCYLDDLPLILGHHSLPKLLLVDLHRKELECQVHHDLAIEVTSIDQVIHIQPLAIVQH